MLSTFMETAEQPADTEFRPLDPSVVALWRVSGGITFGFMLVAALIGLWLLTLAEPMLQLPAVAAAAAAVALAGWAVFPYPSRAYRAWGYRIDDRVLELKSGIVFRVSQLLPLTRLQHVDLRQGPLERHFGLATLALHTAGTREATLRIPGLNYHVAARLRDHLIAVGGDDAV